MTTTLVNRRHIGHTRGGIIGGGVQTRSTNQGAGIHFDLWEESGRETIKTWPVLAFALLRSVYGHPMTLLQMKKPTTAFVFWPRLEIHVGADQIDFLLSSFLQL